MQVTTSTDTPARAKLRYSSPSNTWHTGQFSWSIISGHSSAGQSFQVTVQLVNRFRSRFSWSIISGQGSAGQSFQVMVQLVNHFRSQFSWSIVSGHSSAGQSFQVMFQLVNHFRLCFSKEQETHRMCNLAWKHTFLLTPFPLCFCANLSVPLNIFPCHIMHFSSSVSSPSTSFDINDRTTFTGNLVCGVIDTGTLNHFQMQNLVSPSKHTLTWTKQTSSISLVKSQMQHTSVVTNATH